MFSRAYLLIACFAALPAWSQVEPSASGGPAPEDDSRMMIPPLVSGIPYVSIAGADMRQNYLNTAVKVEAAYIDNVLPDSTATPVADTTYSVFPSLSYLRSTPRQEETLNYSPGFTFYEPTSQLNAVNQSASGNFEGRLSPHVTLELEDNFVRTSNVFDVSYPFSSGGIGGSTQATVPPAIAPFVEQMRNASNANLDYQFSRNGMIGGGGTFSESRFPNPADSAGLYNSNAYGGSAFYSRRVTARQYLGVRYEYDWILGYGPNPQSQNIQVTTQTHTFLPFYTVFFSRYFSLSAAGGATYTELEQTQQPTATAWSGIAVLSLGWQGDKGNVSSSFMRTTLSGAGLLGAFNTVSANLSGGWKISHTWNANMTFTYQNIEPVIPLDFIIYQGGNSFMAQTSVRHNFGDHVTMEFGYQRLYEEFDHIVAVAANPNADREFVNVAYNFKKALGR
jgi:hypothetical protein